VLDGNSETVGVPRTHAIGPKSTRTVAVPPSPDSGATMRPMSESYKLLPKSSAGSDHEDVSGVMSIR
jgi:hypothetical protein